MVPTPTQLRLLSKYSALRTTGGSAHRGGGSNSQGSRDSGIYPSTVHRWLNDGFIAGEQLSPGAPWQIRLNEELRGRFVEQAPPDYLPMLEAQLAV